MIPGKVQNRVESLLIFHSDFQLGGVETWIDDLLAHSKKIDGNVRIPAWKTANKSLGLRASFFPNVARLGRFGSEVMRFMKSDKSRSKFIVHNPKNALLLKVLAPRARYHYISCNDFGKQLTEASAVKRNLFLIIERLILRRALTVFSFSQHDVARIRKIRSDARYLFPSFAAEFLDREVGIERRGVLWVGRLEAVKDPLLALSTFFHSASQHDHDLTMIGRGSLYPAVKSAVENSPYRNRIHLIDALPKAELKHRLSSARLVILTSRAEAGSRFLLEALATGVAVVGTDDADPNNTIYESRGGALSESRNPEILANLLVQELRNPSEPLVEPLMRFEIQKVVSWFEKAVTSSDSASSGDSERKSSAGGALG